MTCTCHCQHVSVSCQLVECIVTEPLMRQIYTEFMNNTVSKTNENWRCFVADDADHVPSHWFSNIESTATTKRVETQTAKSIFDWPGNVITMWCQQQQHVTQSRPARMQTMRSADRPWRGEACWLTGEASSCDGEWLTRCFPPTEILCHSTSHLAALSSHSQRLSPPSACLRLRLLSAVNSSMGSG